MTDKIRFRAAAALMASATRIINDRGTKLNKWLPMIYVVGNRWYYFRNPALRAAIIERLPVERITIDEAYAITHHGKPFRALLPVDKHFNQSGGDFDGFLFSDDFLRTEDAVKKLIRF